VTELPDRLTVSFAEACQLIGVGLTAGRAAHARGEFPVRVIAVGRCLRVPTADLARLLGLTEDGLRYNVSTADTSRLEWSHCWIVEGEDDGDD
jgi:hypothetical protein